MSYYSYHKKLVLEVEGKICFLALYSDSSITTTAVARNGRRYEYHPKSWCHINHDLSFLVTKESFEEQTKKIIDEEFERLQEFYDKYEKGKIATLCYDCYAGTRYPSGRKVRDMKSFYSVKHAINAEEWLKNPINRISFTFSVFSWDTYGERDRQKINITKVEDFLEADKIYTTLKNSLEEKETIYVKVDVSLARR